MWIANYDKKSEMRVVGAEGGIVLEGLLKSLKTWKSFLLACKWWVFLLLKFVPVHLIPVSFGASRNTVITLLRLNLWILQNVKC
jgi:hypothetical protein